MDEIDWSQYKCHLLREVWDALPRGCRLRISIYNGAGEYYSPALDEAHVLAYGNRVVFSAIQKGREVLAIVSPINAPRTNKYYHVPCWD